MEASGGWTGIKSNASFIFDVLNGGSEGAQWGNGAVQGLGQL